MLEGLRGLILICWCTCVIILGLLFRDIARAGGGLANAAGGAGCLGAFLAACGTAALYPYLVGPPDANGLLPLTYGMAAAPFGAALGLWLVRGSGKTR
jgi:hypothetical protein